jgi:hypothetical protein
MDLAAFEQSGSRKQFPSRLPKASTKKIWTLMVDASLRPFFGQRKASTWSTGILKDYRRRRLGERQRGYLQPEVVHAQDGVRPGSQLRAS